MCVRACVRVNVRACMRRAGQLRGVEQVWGRGGGVPLRALLGLHGRERGLQVRAEARVFIGADGDRDGVLARTRTGRNGGKQRAPPQRVCLRSDGEQGEAPRTTERAVRWR